MTKKPENEKKRSPKRNRREREIQKKKNREVGGWVTRHLQKPNLSSQVMSARSKSIARKR